MEYIVPITPINIYYQQVWNTIIFILHLKNHLETFTTAYDVYQCTPGLLYIAYIINDHGSTVQHAVRLISHLSSLQPAVLGGVIDLSILTKAVVEPSKCSDN